MRRAFAIEDEGRIALPAAGMRQIDQVLPWRAERSSASGYFAPASLDPI